MTYLDPLHVGTNFLRCLKHDCAHRLAALSSKAVHAVSSILLHVVHPYALESFRATLGDVRRFHDQLNASSSGSERIQIAKSVFLDTVACSGIKLKELDAVLVAVAEGVKSIDRKSVHPFNLPTQTWLSSCFF